MILVLNPNATPWMTQRVAEALARQLPAGTALEPLTTADGPPVIDTAERFEAGARAGAAALQARLGRAPAPRAVLLACFGDPGLEDLRRLAASRPVVGLAEAAMRAAARRAGRFAVLTCGPAWVPLLQQRARDFGLAEALAGVQALPVDGRTLAQDPGPWRGALQAAADAAVRDGARALVLGGAAFAGLGTLVQSTVPVIDAIEAAAVELGGG
ncbi:aspartate/glutamate racemase family protein [Piscinibacter sakaiensis]|uniref:Hydantoin racemase n=1 Tax=Piscinibacter sakaiensis TaxID=1547922 RepID=A0A0K8P4T6_PISS1|nr:aspartate/glutamate racemase family protein [Piscinibacter sakaiensis]GAP37636.1 hydantoin racemase [Piscinibacter sakaiensis]